jgi:DNA-binding response OmpR family regulator
MVPRLSQPQHVNVLLDSAHWAWPRAVEEIFQPRGVNALVAQSSGDMVRLVDNNRIHLAILDSGREELGGLQTLRMIRKQNELVPCIMLAQCTDKHLLSEALNLGAFCVVAKPVDMQLLAGQVNRLFMKYYDSTIFSEPGDTPVTPRRPGPGVTRRISTVIKWHINRDERSKD